MSHAHCHDCDNFLTDFDRRAMDARAERMIPFVPVPDGDDTDAEFFCADCQDERDGNAYDRKQADDFAAYHGGAGGHQDSVSLLAVMQDARKLK